METLWQDVKFGLRMLAKSPGFTAVAVLTLALGIGANTAIFSLLDAALLRQLPVPEPERLVNFQVQHKNGFDPSFNYPLYTDYRDGNTVLDGLIAYDGVAMTLAGPGSAERIRGMIVSGNAFDVLRIRPARGRWFLPEEDRTPGTHAVVILSDGLWQRNFGGDPELVGRSITLNGRSFTVIGIAPREFTGLMRGFAADFYVPMNMEAVVNPGGRSGRLGMRGFTWLQMIGRLKPGVTREQAQGAMRNLAEQIKSVTPMNTHPELALSDGSRGFTGLVTDLSRPLELLQLVVGLVLLIACANVANLLLARALDRRKEVAVRLVLGAGRGRLVRQLMSESMLLWLAGAAGGLVLAPWVVDLLLYFRPWPSFALDVGLDARVLAFSLLLTLASGLVFGLVSSWQMTRTSLVPALKEERTTVSRGGARLRGSLAVMQLALCLAVLVAAGLCVRSLRSLQSIDAGFDLEKVLALSLDAGRGGYNEERGRVFYAQLLERLAATPGVEAAALAEIVPLTSSGMRITSQPEGHLSTEENPINLSFNVVSPDWLRAMGIPLVRGRDFARTDTAGSAPVVIVNETLAAKYWPGQDPLQRYIEMSGIGPGEKPIRLAVIGVARDSKYRELTEPVPATMLLPLAQNYSSSMVLFLRGDAPAALTGPVRRVVAQLDANLPVFNIRTLATQRDSSLNTWRMASTLLSLLGALGLSLAALGLYGVVAYAVAQRTREIGIRVALGAQRFDVLRLVVGQGLRLVVAGLVFGLAASLAVTRMVGSLLHGVTETDPITFAAVPLLLAVVALLACYFPARRATRIDPMVALRYE